jgi:hypothetical protein
MGDDLQVVAAVERASAHDREPWPGAVRVVDAREADGARALA